MSTKQLRGEAMTHGEIENLAKLNKHVARLYPRPIDRLTRGIVLHRSGLSLIATVVMERNYSTAPDSSWNISTGKPVPDPFAE